MHWTRDTSSFLPCVCVGGNYLLEKEESAQNVRRNFSLRICSVCLSLKLKPTRFTCDMHSSLLRLTVLLLDLLGAERQREALAAVDGTFKSS